MPNDLIALYADPGQAERAVQELAALGVNDLQVASPAPFPVVHKVHRLGPERYLGWIALAGALAGLVAAVSLQVYTSLVHPFIVGGKPVLSWPAFAIVSFELTMLGAGVTNFSAMVVLGALSRRRVPSAAKNAVASDRLALVVPMRSSREGKESQAIVKVLSSASEIVS
jgi:hypothetical protein